MLDFKTFNKYLTFLCKSQIKVDKLEDALKEYSNEFLSLAGMVSENDTQLLNLLRDSMGLKEKDDEFLFDYVFGLNYNILKTEKENKKIYNRIKRIVNSYDKKDNRRNKK